MEVSFLDLEDKGCDEAVLRFEGARLCHLPRWTHMIEKAIGHKGYYLVAREGSDICGVLPLVYVRSKLFGNRIISQPFSDYGGPLANNVDAMDALYERAQGIAQACNCPTIEFRNIEPLPYSLPIRSDKISMYLPLDSDPDNVWAAMRHKTRNRVRKSERSGLTVVSGGKGLLKSFYRIWTIRMRELGTPCYPRKLFSFFMETFPETTRIFLAVLGNHTVAVLFTYTFNNWVQCSWGAALRQYDHMGPNYILNWKAIEYFCKKGMIAFDFGRSTKGSGQHIFKERWGAKPIALNWQYWKLGDDPVEWITPSNPKYQKKVQLWRSLPLWVTRLVGPQISRSLP